MKASYADAHDEAFFAQMRTCREPYRRLADCIHDVLGVQASAFDIGCGIGLQTKRLMELGWTIEGGEYTPVAVEMREPGVEIYEFDLTIPVPTLTDLHMGYDTVICTETAEHIPAEHADTIVQNVAAHANRTILWSAAAPGQDWPGHVNMQPPAYWLGRFEKLNWIPDERRTLQLRELMLTRDAQHVLGRENFFVLVPKPRLHITVVTTALNKEKWVARCIESVQAQTFQDWTHVFVDAKSDDRTFEIAMEASRADRRTVVWLDSLRQSALENAVAVWSALPDDEIVVWLDGDDWLAHDRALDVLASTYADPNVWMTYGQFMFPDGRVGFASRYPEGAAVRQVDWRATHLKTFRAGLVKKIKPLDLAGCNFAVDHAVMYPCLEMAGERYTAIDRVLCVYNFDSSWWATHSSDRELEQAEDARIRAMPPYQRLTQRPW